MGRPLRQTMQTFFDTFILVSHALLSPCFVYVCTIAMHQSVHPPPASPPTSQGQVFKVTVTDRPAGAGGPTLYRLIWTLSSDNYEDMHIYVGDSIFFQV